MHEPVDRTRKAAVFPGRTFFGSADAAAAGDTALFPAASAAKSTGAVLTKSAVDAAAAGVARAATMLARPAAADPSPAAILFFVGVSGAGAGARPMNALTTLPLRLWRMRGPCALTYTEGGKKDKHVHLAVDVGHVDALAGEDFRGEAAAHELNELGQRAVEPVRQPQHRLVQMAREGGHLVLGRRLRLGGLPPGQGRGSIGMHAVSARQAGRRRQVVATRAYA